MIGKVLDPPRYRFTTTLTVECRYENPDHDENLGAEGRFTGSTANDARLAARAAGWIIGKHDLATCPLCKKELADLHRAPPTIRCSS